MRCKCSKEKEGSCWVFCDTKGYAFKEIMNTQGKDNQESSGSCLNTFFNWNLNLVMTMTMMTLTRYISKVEIVIILNQMGIIQKVVCSKRQFKP